MPSGPTLRRGSSAEIGTNTLAPDLTVWSTPWSKNWPKNVNHELNGGERPTSVVTFSMKSVPVAAPLVAGVQPGAFAKLPGVLVTTPRVEVSSSTLPSDGSNVTVRGFGSAPPVTVTFAAPTLGSAASAA